MIERVFPRDGDFPRCVFSSYLSLHELHMIAAQDTYTTSPNRKRLRFGNPTFAFYRRMLAAVFRSSQMAKRGKYTDDVWVEMSRRIMDALEYVGCRFTITGMDSFRSFEGPAVFVGNHMSTLETFVLPCIIQPVKPVTFIVKQSLIDYPVFRHIMRSRNPVVVNRDNPREDLVTVLREGDRRLRGGVSIIVFPQTTRTNDFTPDDFNTLGVKLAKNAGVPLVPMALKTDAWANGKYLKDFGRIDPSLSVHIAFGEPLDITGAGREQHARVIAFISERWKTWNAVETS